MGNFSEETLPDLQIAGLTPLSTCDWPGKLVATVFLQGCPWSCNYCHNPDLMSCITPGKFQWSDVVDLLNKRQGLLDGVVFTGGEPTRQAGLLEAAKAVRSLGFKVGLHTSGSYPSRFMKVLDYVDWVGFDVKALPEQYVAITQVAASAYKAYESLDILLASGVDYQVRTTVDPTVQTDDDIKQLTEQLIARGVKNHVLQQVRTVGTTDQYNSTLEDC